MAEAKNRFVKLHEKPNDATVGFGRQMRFPSDCRMIAFPSA
jgi:hypothetical protein